MKLTILIAILFIAVNVEYISAFGGDRDSLLFDGASEIKVAGTFYDGECPVTVRYARGKVNGVKYTENIVTDCSGKEIDRFNKRESSGLIKGDKVYLGENITTGDDGYAEIELEDGSVMRMGPNSIVRVEQDFCHSRNITQTLGFIWVKVKKLLGGGKFEVSSQGMAVGVRGTEFTIEISEEKATVKVYESSVEVRPLVTGNEKGVEDAGKEIEKLTEDLQNGKITPEEFTQKVQEYQNKMQGNSKNVTKSVIVESGYMVPVTNIIGNVEPIPASDVKWFEDSNFYK